MVLKTWLFLIFVLAQNVFSIKLSTTSTERQLPLLLSPQPLNISPKPVNISPNEVPKNCLEVQNSGQTSSGIYKIKPKTSSKVFLVYCDLKTKDGGWTYLLNRLDGTENFNLAWEDYKWGFGNLNGEFWLGLEHLHELTGDGGYELLIELEDWVKVKVYARYSLFAIGSELEGYSLKVLGGYSGDAGDSLSYSAGTKFSTKDKDQDHSPNNCADIHGGAWWYRNCMHALLTGNYMKESVPPDQEHKIMYWESFRGTRYSLKIARMMVKPIKVDQ
ncbi:angiopoietin-related protein 1-like [Tribolium madens]|uniref:angiopoietin-related protein 1-like n=1 Tax=Tribolium madens TaxID=41895 RepID=UPI001CF75DED|nr:angiopoietin-related protein 1-like [Tribolium madens]